METQQSKAKSVTAPLKKVTPLSKYLTMVLFVTLPFVGGFIGYQYAPEKLTEVEKVIEVEKIQPVADVQVENDLPSNADIGIILAKYIGDEVIVKNLEFIYTTKENEARFFLYGCYQFARHGCRIYKYLSSTNKVYDTGLVIRYVIGEKESPTGRYVAKVKDNYSLYVYDLETQSIEYSDTVAWRITLVSSICGPEGSTFDLQWLDENTLQYGLYRDLIDEDIDCSEKMEFLQHQTVGME